MQRLGDVPLAVVSYQHKLFAQGVVVDLYLVHLVGAGPVVQFVSFESGVKEPVVPVGVDVVGLGVERRLPQAVVVALPNDGLVVIKVGHQTDEFSIQRLKIIRRSRQESLVRQQFVKLPGHSFRGSVA